MPFREKIAWISLLTMLGVFGVFYGAVALGRLPSHGFATLHAMILSVLAVILLQAGLGFVAARLSGGDARTPKDERERLIEMKAFRIAYYVLVLGVLAALFAAIHGPLGHVGPPEVGLAVTAMVVLAHVVKQAAQIVYFRRGA